LALLILGEVFNLIEKLVYKIMLNSETRYEEGNIEKGIGEIILKVSLIEYLDYISLYYLNPNK
jgi:hypothetical protein